MTTYRGITIKGEKPTIDKDNSSTDETYYNYSGYSIFVDKNTSGYGKVRVKGKWFSYLWEALKFVDTLNS